MNLHEYQAKDLLEKSHIPVPRRILIRHRDEVDRVSAELGGKAWVVKAQVHTGGRGKAGGVRLVSGRDELQDAVKSLLGSRLITRQTGGHGLPVEKVLVEPRLEIVQEFYIGLLVDRERRCITVIASAAGGMDIEEVATQTPDRIVTETVNPLTNLAPYQTRRLGFALGLKKPQITQFAVILQNLYRLFVEHDASLVEVNPLVMTGDSALTALDAKVILDDNALFRHPALSELRDSHQEDPLEAEARLYGLNYIQLEGDIGCMVNGAGLAMATMDLIKLHGGNPANFLDVGGDATAERVAQAFKLIISNRRVNSILVNIFGGIVRCDLIADGILRAIKEIQVNLPIVVRLEGTNVEEGRQRLLNGGLDVILANDLSDAASICVTAAENPS